jgi:hypothetical protein
MRAILRRYLAPLVVAAVVISAGGAAGFAAVSAHPGGSLAECPAGTNWDNVTGTCV